MIFDVALSNSWLDVEVSVRIDMINEIQFNGLQRSTQSRDSYVHGDDGGDRLKILKRLGESDEGGRMNRW